MKNELDPSKVLQAYENVMNNGSPTEFGKIYEGVEAFSDYDGYNVFLRGNGVELKVGFHNTYHLEYEQEHLKETFFEKDCDAGEIGRHFPCTKIADIKKALGRTRPWALGEEMGQKRSLTPNDERLLNI